MPYRRMHYYCYYRRQQLRAGDHEQASLTLNLAQIPEDHTPGDYPAWAAARQALLRALSCLRRPCRPKQLRTGAQGELALIYLVQRHYSRAA